VARWWFVRHGQSVANAGGWLSGHRDVALTAAGVEQARALKEVLRPLTPDRVLSSDLERAWKTAALAWDHRLPPYRRTPHLRERALGAWEGMAVADLAKGDAMEILWSWKGRPPNGESHHDLSLRVLRYLAEVDDGKDTLIFAHGGLIRCVVGLVDGRPLEQIGRDKIANVQVVDRVVPPGTWGKLHRALER
jgi:broad specificity phosphatase PhoE